MIYNRHLELVRKFQKGQSLAHTDTDFVAYREFISSLPENLKPKVGSNYDMRYMWDNQGKPKHFQELEGSMFNYQENDKLYHGSSIEPKTLRFLKTKSHPSIQKELDWYNSEEGSEFRGNYELGNSKENPEYYQYFKRSNNM